MGHGWGMEEGAELPLKQLQETNMEKVVPDGKQAPQVQEQK